MKESLCEREWDGEKSTYDSEDEYVWIGQEHDVPDGCVFESKIPPFSRVLFSFLLLFCKINEIWFFL